MGQGENLSSKESKSETHRQLVLVLVTGSDLYFSSVYLYFIMVMDTFSTTSDDMKHANKEIRLTNGSETIMTIIVHSLFLEVRIQEITILMSVKIFKLLTFFSFLYLCTFSSNKIVCRIGAGV